MKILRSKALAFPLLRFDHKRIRAEVIREYMNDAGYTRAVCFSCGNAARALESAGVETIHIGENGVFRPNKWFSPAEVRNIWPDAFDATSGHLGAFLMVKIGQRYRESLGELPDVVYVPSGSGETLCCLKMAYPQNEFIAVYGLDKATEYSDSAPLNNLVELLAFDVYHAEE